MNENKTEGAIARWFKKYYIALLAGLFVAVLVAGVFFVYGGDGDGGEDGSTVSEASKEEEVRYYIIDIDDMSPYVELGKYKGVEIEFSKVDDELIDYYRKAALASVREFVDTNKPAQKGDTILLDYEGFYKESGKKFSGGTDTNVTMESLGDAGYIPGFEDQIVGHNAGETFDIFVVFPDNYGSEDLRGVEARFNIKLKKVTRVVYPEITDELAKKLNYKDAKALNEAINTAAEKKVRAENLDKAWKAVVAACTVKEYPKELYDQAVNDFVEYYMDYYKSKAAEYGVELEELLDQTEEELKAELLQKGKENANGYVKEELFMYAIAKDLGVDTITDEEYAAKVQEFATNEGVTTDKLKESYTEEQLRTNILWDRVMTYVYDNAVEKAPDESSSEDSEGSSEELSEESATSSEG